MSVETGLTLYWHLSALLLGLVVGSFLNVVISRLPEELSIAFPGSRCPKCETPIRWYDNLPVLSWLLLGGKCRACKAPISFQYPAVELLTGVLSVLTFRRFVSDTAAPSVEGMILYFIYFAFVAALVAVTFIDLEHYIIPNEISLPGTALGLLAVAALDYVEMGRLTWQSSLAGAVIGAGGLLLVMGIYWLVRRAEGMGLGDVKLMAMIGAFLGAHPALLFVLFFSSFTGSVVGISIMVIKGKDLKHAIPFGPFLASGAVIYLLWGPQLVATLLPAMAGPR